MDELLYGGRKKRYISLGIRVLLYTVIITIITAFCLYMPLYKDNYTSFYSNSSYDYFIQETDKQQLMELAEKDYVEGIFPFSLMIFNLKKNVNAIENDGANIAFLTTSSFEGLEYSSFAPENLISEDKTILNDPTCNPIIIDYSLSKTEGISVGDTFTLYSEKMLGGMEKKFTVGAIYQNHCEFGMYDAVILINEKTNNDMLQLDPSAGYSLAYVKAKELTVFEEYLENEFYPHLSFTKEEFKSLPIEQQKTYYTSKAQLMAEAEQDLDFSTPGMIVIALVAFVSLIMLIKREHEKCVENNMYNIAVLYSLGLKKKTLLMKLFKNSFVPVLISIILACILNKFVVFQVITAGIYVPVRSIISYGIGCLGVTFAVIIAVTFALTAKKITPERVLDCISNEKRT